MKRRQFVSSAALATAALGLRSAIAGTSKTPPASREIYELREYSLRWNTNEMDKYLSQALIPALNRAGVTKVGAWKEAGHADPPKLYLLITYPSLQGYLDIAGKLKADAAYQTASQAYNAIPVTNPVYERFSTSLMIAFEGFPQLKPLTKTQRFIEMRRYESYSEDAATRKIAMFNKEEFPIFEATGLHMMFFGQVIAGEKMPCLTYMLGFDNEQERDANWKKFLDHPDWKRITAMPEYANTVSKVVKIYLEPMPYSQI